MKTNKGLHLDGRPEDQPEGTYPYGKNGIQHDLIGAISNEPGFRKIVTESVPFGYQINGILETDSDLVIVFSTNNLYSCIRLVNLTTGFIVFTFNDQFKPYKLNFSVDRYITGQVQRNYLGELVCAFTDKTTFPKFINFDDPQVAQLKDWNLFPECDFPTVAKKTVSGGFIPVGAYFFAGRYYAKDGTRTSFSQVSSGIGVTSEASQDTADKSIQLTITDMDLSYQFYEIAVLSKRNGVTSAKLIRKVPVLPGTQTVVFTGNDFYEDIPLEEVLVSQVNYDIVGSMAQLNDALYLGKLQKNRLVVDMQKYASMVKLFWVSELIDLENPPQELKEGRKKSLMHGETYAGYIRYKLSDGTFSPSYTIPGIAADAAHLLTSTVATTGGLGNTPVYKVEDCITVYSTADFNGQPGPYLNETELYPNTDDFDSSAVGGEDYRNTTVRHHKMPSLKWCKENLYPTETEYGVTKLDVLGLQAFNVVIPPEYQGVIVGYEILYAKRTVQNMTQYGQGLLLYGHYLSNVLGVPIDATTVYSAGHNWNLQQASSQNYRVKQNYMRFHGFDILFNKPGILPSHITAQYKLEAPVDKMYYAFSYPSTGSPSDSVGNSVTKVDMMNGTSSNAPTNNIQALEEPLYLLNNYNYGEYVNQYLESAFVGKLLGASLPLSINANDPGSQGNFSGTPKVQAHVINLSDVKTDLYLNFYTQELVSLGDPLPIGSTTVQYGGDVFINPYTFHTYGIADTAWDIPYSTSSQYADPEMRARRVINRFVCESVSNLWTRYEILGNQYSKWFPNTALPVQGAALRPYPAEYNGFSDPNQFGYTKGSEVVNDFVSDDIFNPYRVYQTDFPYRIQRGGKLSRENTRSWRTFLPLDYYEMQRNRGFIEHLEGMDDRLLIHMTNALFITQDKGKLEGGMLSITLGSGDIFQFEPQEVQSSKLGYAGTQTDLACIRTPLGYVYADTKQGEFYMYKDKELKMLNEGVHRFLREYLKVLGNNPFTGNGVTLGWDQKYKRILATVKNIRPAGNPTVTIINSSSDIKSIGPLMGAVNYDDVLYTTNGTVVPGGIVFMNNRFLVYKGINNVTPGAESDYACIPDDVPCDAPLDIEVTQLLDPPFAHISWGGAAGNFVWELYKVDSGQLVLISYGSTIYQFQDFDNAQLDPDVSYLFNLRRVCGTTYSTPVVCTFSFPAPIVITPPTPGGGLVAFRFMNMKRALHSCGVISNGTNNVVSANLTVNGVLVGNYPLQTTGPCFYSTLGLGAWYHSFQIGPYFLATVAAPLANATIVVECLDGSNNPASGAFAPVDLYDTSLSPCPGVLSGSNNHICTWTNVDLTNASYYDLTV